MLLKGSPSSTPPAATVVFLQVSVSPQHCPWDAAERGKLARREGDGFPSHVLPSDIVAPLGMRTLKYGGFGSVIKTKDLFMRFGGSSAYKKGSLMTGESLWNKRFSVTHMVSDGVQPSQAQAVRGRGDSCFTLDLVYLVTSILKQNSPFL